eukprot:4347263-Prymnesium_polylepis.1
MATREAVGRRERRARHVRVRHVLSPLGVAGVVHPQHVAVDERAEVSPVNLAEAARRGREGTLTMWSCGVE